MQIAAHIIPIVRGKTLSLEIPAGTDVINALSLWADQAEMDIAFCTTGILVAPGVVCGCMHDHTEFQAMTHPLPEALDCSIDLNTQREIAARYPVLFCLDDPAHELFGTIYGDVFHDDGSRALDAAEVVFNGLEASSLPVGSIETHLGEATIPGLPAGFQPFGEASTTEG